jgi:hypothetical protein
VEASREIEKVVDRSFAEGEEGETRVSAAAGSDIGPHRKETRSWSTKSTAVPFAVLVADRRITALPRSVFHDHTVCYYVFSFQSPVPMTTIRPRPADVRRSVLVLDERLGRQHVRLDHLADERVEVDLAPPAELRLRLSRVPEEQPDDP